MKKPESSGAVQEEENGANSSSAAAGLLLLLQQWSANEARIEAAFFAHCPPVIEKRPTTSSDGATKRRPGEASPMRWQVAHRPQSRPVV
jgi:hypothetical protein